jgi:hypothetical protein
MKNSRGIIGNRTRDLPVCSAVPQPTAPPRAPVPFFSVLYVLYINITTRRDILYVVLNGASSREGLTPSARLGRHQSRL